MSDSTSGGVNIDSDNTSIGGDVVGRDKIIQITNTIVQQAQAARERQPLRVLAVIAAPGAGQREIDPPPASLSGRAEWKALRASTKVAPMLLARLRPPTALALRTTLAPNNAGAFNIVHFISHGLPGALALDDVRGLMKIDKAVELAAVLKDGDVQLAVINACYSAAGDAQSIAQSLVAAGVRSVVAHRWPLIDPAAIVFSRELYRELAAGQSLRAAFDQAVTETTAQYAAEKGNAVLLGDATLRFLRPASEVEPSRVIEGAALPDKAARFFGRGRELIQLADIFASDSLRGAALTGIGGIGKSALAFEAADRLAWRFDDRVAYVEASEVGFKAADALTELARGLGLKDAADPAAELRDFVNRQPCLLLFDNMERAGSELYKLADFVSSLNLDAGTQVLFTLRPPLSDKFHDIYEVPLVRGLDERAALDFVRTTAYNLHAAPEWQQPAEARALVNRVQGHPELMRLTVYRSLKTPFARVKRELAELSGKLDEALQDLIGKQVADAGQVARQALACLTIFPQPRMIVEAAAAACGDDADGLEALTEHGVIALERDGAERYALHATAVDYARSKMRDAEMQDARQRAAKAYSEIADKHANESDIYAGEHDNYMAALDWAWASEMWAEVASMVQGAVGYLRMKGYWQDGFNWMRRAIEARRKLPESIENKKQIAYHLDSLGRFYGDQGDIDSAMRCLEESARVLKELNDESGFATVIHVTAGMLVTRGDLDGALDLYRQSLEIKERLGDAKGKAATLSQMANLEMNQGNWDMAREHIAEALEISKRLSDLREIGINTAKLGQIAEHVMDLLEAARLYRESAGYFEKLGSPVAGQVKGMLAAVLQRMGAVNGR
ncbi:MAG: CHAT domain-containing protein [Chloroflexi bacterium]|nr:CHAT domain-containing protein [Chloroflexota bacterium]